MLTCGFSPACCKYHHPPALHHSLAKRHVLSVMSPNGTLLAYSTPVDIRDLRDQAALISMAWKEHEAALHAKAGKGSIHSGAGQAEENSSLLETLTIEFQYNNVIVRAIQPNLLLVVVGSVPPSRKREFKITAEAYGDPRYPPAEHQETASTVQPEETQSTNQSSSPTGTDSGTVQRPGSIAPSHMSQLEKDIKVGVLHIQRKKVDAMTEFIRQDFDARGFVMPDDSSFP